MAKIGDLYIGGEETLAQGLEAFPSGIAFPIQGKPEIDYIWDSDNSEWQVELKKEHGHVVARSRKPQEYKILVTSGLEQVQRCLDLIAFKKRGIFVVYQPELDHVAVFQREGHYVLRHFSVTTLAIETNVTIEVRDKNGEIKPPPPVPEPTWTWAFRYYRLSQASNDIFEAYRNLFLSLEALLNEICPKQSSEGERKWLERSLSQVATQLELAHYVPETIGSPIDYLMKTQYTDVRCRLFHAKYPDALLPHDQVNPTDVLAAYETLLLLWRDIAAAYFKVPRGGSVVTYQGFKFLMDATFGRPLSLHFTEDKSPPRREDTVISPLGFATFEFDDSSYFGETKPGFVSWLGETTLQGMHKGLTVHRICSKLGDTLFNVAFIESGLSPTGVDIFQTYQSAMLVNKGQPKTTF